jgi:hypothetical protein
MLDKELARSSLSYILTKFVMYELELQINLLFKYYLISIIFQKIC